MSEQSEELARLQNSLQAYLRPRAEVSHIRRVLALHLREAHRSETEKDGASRPLSLQELNDHVKSSSSRGLRREYLKSLRANSKARKEYDSISSEHLVQNQKKSSREDAENPLQSYVLLLKQQQKLEKLKILARYLDLLDQKPAASQSFLDPKLITKDIEPLPPIPSAVLNDERYDKQSSAKSVTELMHQLEKAVLQAKCLLDAEKRQTSECQSRLSQVEKSSPRSNVKQRLEALGRTRNEMISWMEEQLGKSGDSEPDDVEDAIIPRPKLSSESQLINIQKEYRKYVIVRQELLLTLRSQVDGLESTHSDESVDKPQTSQDAPETAQRKDLLHPYLTELLSISNEQKSQTLQRSHLNTSLAKQLKENMQSLDRLAEESHLLPTYPMKGLRPKRLAERPDLSGGLLVVSERPDFIARARGWVFAADAAAHATKDAVLEKVEEGRAAVDESLQTLLELHQLLGYDLEDAGVDANEDDIWAPDAKTPKKGNDLDGKAEQSRRDIWSTIDGNLGVIKREDK